VQTTQVLYSAYTVTRSTARMYQLVTKPETWSSFKYLSKLMLRFKNWI